MNMREPDVYTLDDSEYEVLESESRGPITSEEVKKKLNSDNPFLGPIEQSDFDDKDYTVSDYLWIDDDDYPRNIRDNKATLAGSTAALGVYLAASGSLKTDPAFMGSALAGFATANYAMGLHIQDQEFSTAMSNSIENMFDNE